MKDIINNISAFFSRRDVQNGSFYFVVILFFVLVYILNILFPLQADDWGYSFIFNYANNHTVRIHNVLDIFVSQYNHYCGWGGRSVVHFIDQFLLFIDIRVAKLLNSIVYICLFLMIYKIINKGKKTNVGLFILLNITIWLIQTAFSIVILWLTGSANYGWGALLLILFIYPYYIFYLDKTSKDSYLKALLFFLWGIVSGWTNENASLAMIFLLVILMCYSKYYQKVQLPKWVVFGIVGACVGCAFMLLAPGNQVRLSMFPNDIGSSSLPAFKIFKIRVYNLYNAGGLRLFSFSAVYAIFVFLYLKMGETKNRIDTLFLSFVFLIAGFVGFVVLYPVPYFPRDAWTSIHIFFFIAIGLLYVNISFNKLWMKICRSAICIILIVAFINHYAKLYKEVDYFSVKSKERELFVEQEKAKGKVDIVIPEKMTFPQGSLLSDPLLEYEDYWTNGLYSRYYGLHSIRLKRADE